MRLPLMMIGLATACGVSVIALYAQAQPAGGVFRCATSIGNGLGATTYTDLSLVQNVGKDCLSSIVLVFDGNAPATNNEGEIIQLAVERCGLWDGPYRRLLPSAVGNPNYDYVIVTAPNLSSTVMTGASSNNPSVFQQIGVGEPSGPDSLQLSISVTGTTSSNSAVLTVEDTSVGPSQILDFPGPEFMYGVKSQGQGNPIQATLVCAVNAWYWAGFTGDPNAGFAGKFGFSNFPFKHNVNSITAGWGAGPSGMLKQANITSACNNMNGLLTVDNQTAPGTPQQQYVGKLYGTYKSKGTNPPAPTFNVSNCSDDPKEYERVCSTLEPPGFGRPNSCNPDGGVANGISASIVQTQSGLNSHCTGHFSFSTGFGITSYGSC